MSNSAELGLELHMIDEAPSSEQVTSNPSVEQQKKSIDDLVDNRQSRRGPWEVYARQMGWEINMDIA